MTMQLRRRRGSASFADVYGAQGAADTFGATPPPIDDGSPIGRRATWELGRLAANETTSKPFTIPQNARSLVVVNQSDAHLYISYRETPVPSADFDFELMCPPRSMLVVPALGGPADRDQAIIATLWYPHSGGVPLVPLLGDQGPAVIYVSELEFEPSLSSIVPLATQRTIAELVLAVQKGTVYNSFLYTTPITVGTAAIQLTSGLDTGAVEIQNLGPAAIYVSGANTVTVGTGREVIAGESWTITIGPDVELWAISGSAGNDVRVTEAG
jgi:hypothetical protein